MSAWRVVEVGRRPPGVSVFRDQRAGRTVVELGGVIVGWFTDRQQLEGGELLIDWHAVDEGLRALAEVAPCDPTECRNLNAAGFCPTCGPFPATDPHCSEEEP